MERRHGGEEGETERDKLWSESPVGIVNLNLSSVDDENQPRSD